MENIINAVQNLERVIDFLREHVQSDWQLQQFRIFLEIAKHDPTGGVTQPQLAEDFHLAQAVISRNCRSLAKVARNGEIAGHDLIYMTPDLFETRRFNCRLTSKGKKVYAKIQELLGR